MRYSDSKSSELFGAKKHKQLVKLFSRNGLSSEQRLICSISALQATGDNKNLHKMIKLAIVNEQDIVEIYEILLQGYLFCGYPKAIESFFCLEGALKDMDMILPPKTPIPMLTQEKARNRGEQLARKIHRAKFERIHNKINALCPDLGYLMLAEGYGHILCRKGVKLPIRELAVVSSLSASQAHRQLNSHIRGAMNVGCSKRSVLEAILTVMPWSGLRAVSNSLNVWSKIVGESALSKEMLQGLNICK